MTKEEHEYLTMLGFKRVDSDKYNLISDTGLMSYYPISKGLYIGGVDSGLRKTQWFRKITDIKQIGEILKLLR